MSSWEIKHVSGITLRDLFAACAIIGTADTASNETSRRAYRLANQMIAKRTGADVDEFTRGWRNAAEFLNAMGFHAPADVLKENEPNERGDNDEP